MESDTSNKKDSCWLHPITFGVILAAANILFLIITKPIGYKLISIGISIAGFLLFIRFQRIRKILFVVFILAIVGFYVILSSYPIL